MSVTNYMSFIHTVINRNRLLVCNWFNTKKFVTSLMSKEIKDSRLILFSEQEYMYMNILKNMYIFIDIFDIIQHSKIFMDVSFLFER